MIRPSLFIALVILLVITSSVFFMKSEQVVASRVPDITSASEYNIVYLVAEDKQLSNLMLPSRLVADLGVNTVRKWEEVVTIENSHAIDALIIHQEAISTVDQEWLARAYRQGVVISVFDTPIQKLADLIDDHCIVQDNDFPTGVDKDIFITVHLLLLGHSEDVARWEKARRDSCLDAAADGILNPLTVSMGISSDRLRNEKNYQFFIYSILSKLESNQKISERPNRPDSVCQIGSTCEDKTVGGIRVRTFHASDSYRARTDYSGQLYYISAWMRAWGNNGDGSWRVKDEDRTAKFNSSNAINNKGAYHALGPTWVSRHFGQYYQGGYGGTFYTSFNQCQSSLLFVSLVFVLPSLRSEG
jgi:hypothetical protein